MEHLNLGPVGGWSPFAVAVGTGSGVSTGWMALRPCCAINSHGDKTLAALSHMEKVHWRARGPSLLSVAASFQGCCGLNLLFVGS